jgi:transketolase
LAGHLKLSNLCWIYDNNRITIEGNTALACSDDAATRFIGYGWNVTRVGDCQRLGDARACIRDVQGTRPTGPRSSSWTAISHMARPTSRIPARLHGEPLGKDEIKLAKRNYGWPEDAQFLVPEGVREHFRAGIGTRGQALHDAWWAKFEAYKRQYPDLADQGYRMLRRELPPGWDKELPVFRADSKGLATRDASGQTLNAIAKNVPWMIGGSADLGPSCKTRLTSADAGDFNADNGAGAQFALWHPRARRWAPS